MHSDIGISLAVTKGVGGWWIGSLGLTDGNIYIEWINKKHGPTI